MKRRACALESGATVVPMLPRGPGSRQGLQPPLGCTTRPARPWRSQPATASSAATLPPTATTVNNAARQSPQRVMYSMC